MNTENERFERAISEAFEQQVENTSTPSWDARRQIVSRGRRRRTLRVLGSVALVAVVVFGASTTVGAFRDQRTRLAGPDVPVIGSERVMDFGGPIAATDDALFVANGFGSNDAGDKESIARFDLESRDVTNTDPTSMTPHNVSMGTAGLWMVGWSGDLPLEDGGGAHGRIQLVDPVSGEVLLDIPRDSSAPYDVAAGESNGRAVGWVVDAGRRQLVEVDAESGEIETIELEGRPNDVIFDAGVVWVTSNASGRGSLTRFDLASGSLQTFDVDHCMNDLVVFDGSVWVADFCDEAVHRFDATTGEELATVPLDAPASAITVADGLVWVKRDNEVVRVDPHTEKIVGDPIVVGEGEFGEFLDAHMVSARDGVYLSSDGGVYRLAEGLPVRELRPAPTPTPEETKDPLASETCSLDRVMCIPLDREWSIVGTGFGSAWVGNIGEGKTFGIARFDAESGEEVTRLRTDGFVQGFAPDERWMWALMEAGDQLTLHKIDPETTSAVDSYDIGSTGNIGTASVAAGGGFVWVSLSNGDVARISAGTGNVTTFSYGRDLPDYGVSNGPLNLAFGEDHLWLSYGQGHLGLVDPSSGDLLRYEEDALGVNAYQILLAGDAVWSPHQSVDGDNVVTYSSISGPGKDEGRVVLVKNAPPGLAATDTEHIWVIQNGFDEKASGWLVEIDAVTRERVGEPLEIETEFQGGVAAGDGFVWVTGNRVLYRVEASD